MIKPVADNKTEWDDDKRGFVFEGEHYNLMAGDHDVVVSVCFEDWEKHYKSASVVRGGLMGTDEIFKSDAGEIEHAWIVLVDTFDLDIACDLYPELEDGDIADESYLTKEQLLAYQREAFKRGACELRHSDITMEVYSDDEEEMSRDDIARVVGLDPAHTSVSFNG